MSAPLWDRLRELVPALGTVPGLAYADTNGTAVLGIEAQRALITALTPCPCGAVAGQDCAPDCDLDAGACEGCDACDAWLCECLCGCDAWLPVPRRGQTCDACHDRCVGSGAFPAPAGAWISDKAGAWSHCGKIATPQREGAGIIAVCGACGDVAVIDCGAP